LRQTSQALDSGFQPHLEQLASRADAGGKCLYYVRRVTGTRVSALAFDETTARGGVGAWAIDVYGTYYAGDGSIHVGHSLFLELMRFELRGGRLLSRPLTGSEARTFEVALSR
jgi:hypothetical protein